MVSEHVQHDVTQAWQCVFFVIYRTSCVFWHMRTGDLENFKSSPVAPLQSCDIRSCWNSTLAKWKSHNRRPDFSIPPLKNIDHFKIQLKVQKEKQFKLAQYEKTKLQFLLPSSISGDFNALANCHWLSGLCKATRSMRCLATAGGVTYWQVH